MHTKLLRDFFIVSSLPFVKKIIHLIKNIIQQIFIKVNNYLTYIILKSDNKRPPFQEVLNQLINIASPKLKKRYSSFTACSYAFSIFSFPASALTSITSVDFGK